MKKVFISTASFGKNSPQPLEMLKREGILFELNPYGRTLRESEIKEFIGDIDGLIAGVETLSRPVIRNANKLKIISRCGVGLDNIDIEAAGEKKIKIVSTQDVLTDAVAELTLGLMLNLLRHICIHDKSLRDGKWQKIMGTLLKEKKVGIVGCGRIGKRLVKLLEPLSAKIMIYDPYIDKKGIKGAEVIDTLEDLLMSVDILTLHLPCTKENEFLIDKKAIAKMRPGAYLINTSRGRIVDEQALFSALKDGLLAGAAIDTFEHEPYDGPLKELDNIILTPHIGSYAKEARVEMEMQAVKNLLEGLNG